MHHWWSKSVSNSINSFHVSIHSQCPCKCYLLFCCLLILHYILRNVSTIQQSWLFLLLVLHEATHTPISKRELKLSKSVLFHHQVQLLFYQGKRNPSFSDNGLLWRHYTLNSLVLASDCHKSLKLALKDFLDPLIPELCHSPFLNSKPPRLPEYYGP